MKNWLDIEIKKLGRVVTGKTPPTADRSYFDGPYHFVSPKDLDYDSSFIKSTLTTVTEKSIEKFKNQILPENSVMFTSLSFGFGKIGITNSISLTNQQINSIIVDESKHDFRFVYYLLRHYKDKIFAYNAGIVTPIVPKSVFEKIQVRIPESKTFQRKIASILSAYDDLIENNLKRIKLLEEKAFVAYKILMSSEKLIEGKVGDLADVKSGFAFKGADWTDDGFPVIKIKNIGNNDIDLTDCSLIPENIAEAAAKFKLNAGDLLIAMTGATVGKIGMMPRTETSFYLNQRVGIFKPKIENAELFLFCFYNELSAKDAVESLASGAAQPNISGGQLESIKLFYPKLETVTEFGSSIKSHFELIWNLKQQNTKLREARDILLPRLMNGQIEV